MRQIFDIIKNLRKMGRTILLVEQMANLALRVADRAYILEQGQVVLEGQSEELLSQSRCRTRVSRRRRKADHSSNRDSQKSK